ncbi:MAG: hypothetical protein NTU95_02740 [Methanothrix sp.]|nr:hypothetical protein [Methanothrix sp.]
MDGIEFLLLKWDDMNNKHKAFVLILGLGAFAFALDQVLGFISKWIIPALSQNILSYSPNWVISTISFIPFAYLPLIFLYTYITILLINRTRAKTEEIVTTGFNKKIESEQKQRVATDILLRSEREKFKTEIGECIEHHKRLLNVLDGINKERQRQRMLEMEPINLYQDRFQTKKIKYQADVILDKTSPEEIFYHEEEAWMKKHDKEK